MLDGIFNDLRLYSTIGRYNNLHCARKGLRGSIGRPFSLSDFPEENSRGSLGPGSPVCLSDFDFSVKPVKEQPKITRLESESVPEVQERGLTPLEKGIFAIGLGLALMPLVPKK